MKVYYKEWQSEVPLPLPQVWDFFSRPENLAKMMPDEMGFNILSDIAGVPMYEGMMLRYRVAPILNIPMDWCTEITKIEKHKYFVDDQRSGPYAMWHHEHHFQETPTGTLMTDKLHYAIPLGPFGQMAHWLFVEKKIEEIFMMREQFIPRIGESN